MAALKWFLVCIEEQRVTVALLDAESKDVADVKYSNEVADFAFSNDVAAVAYSNDVADVA